MDYLTVAVMAVPAAIGIVAALWLGPNRGTLLGAAIMLIAVFILLLFQITIPQSGPGANISRASYAWSLMQFEWYRWLLSFVVGAAIGSVVWRVRRRPAAS